MKRQPQAAETPAAGTTRTPVSPGREGMLVSVSPRKLIRPAGMVVLLVACLSIVTGFTATNTVPVTRAGKSAQAVSYEQMAPTRCAAILINNGAVINSTAMTLNGTSDNDLLIGANRTGTITYNGNAGNDCIVAGGRPGTKNILDGGTGSNDICIGAPAPATNTFKNCDRTY